MRNFFPFLPTIPFGNQKMKILETKNQKVDMDMHNSKLFNFVWKTILSNFCNYPFANSMSIFGFLKVFFLNNWPFDKLFSPNVKILPKNLKRSRLFVTQNRCYNFTRVKIVHFVFLDLKCLCAHCTASCLTLVDVFFEEV